VSQRRGHIAVAAVLALGAAACVRLAPGSPVAPRPDRPLAELVQPALDQVAARYLRVAAARDPANGIPRHTVAGNAWHATGMDDWTSGFFPGTLWYLYAATGNDDQDREENPRNRPEETGQGLRAPTPATPAATSHGAAQAPAPFTTVCVAP